MKFGAALIRCLLTACTRRCASCLESENHHPPCIVRQPSIVFLLPSTFVWLLPRLFLRHVPLGDHRYASAISSAIITIVIRVASASGSRFAIPSSSVLLRPPGVALSFAIMIRRCVALPGGRDHTDNHMNISAAVWAQSNW